MTTPAVARVTRVRQGVERDCHLMAIVRIFEELLPKLAGVRQRRHVRARLELDRDIVLVRPRCCHCDNVFPVWL